MNNGQGNNVRGKSSLGQTVNETMESALLLHLHKLPMLLGI